MKVLDHLRKEMLCWFLLGQKRFLYFHYTSDVRFLRTAHYRQVILRDPHRLGIQLSTRVRSAVYPLVALASLAYSHRRQ